MAQGVYPDGGANVVGDTPDLLVGQTAQPLSQNKDGELRVITGRDLLEALEQLTAEVRKLRRHMEFTSGTEL